MQTAVFATARKLAQLVNRILRCGQKYVDEGEAADEERYCQRTPAYIKRTARDLDYTVVANTAPPATPDPV